MASTLKDNQISYIPNKGIYKWNSEKGQYDTLTGEDISPLDGTGVIHPIPITDEILSVLGFKIKDGGFVNGNLKIDRNLQAPLFTINGIAVKDLTDLYSHMTNQSITLDFRNLLTLLSPDKRKQ